MIRCWMSSSIALVSVFAVIAGLSTSKAIAGTTAEVQLSGTVAPALKLSTTSNSDNTFQMLSNRSSDDQQMLPGAHLNFATNGEQEYVLKFIASDLGNNGDNRIPTQAVIVSSGIKSNSTDTSATMELRNDTVTSISTRDTQNVSIQCKSTSAQTLQACSGTISISVIDN
jgi:hypothetical protein